jgi:hypothetical protein
VVTYDWRKMEMILNRLFNKRKKSNKTMAKAPHIGSRKAVAEYGFNKVLKKDSSLKVIQPVILSHHDDTFFWSCKVIKVHQAGSIGISRKTEEGFLVIEEKNEKFKLLLKVLNDKVAKLPVIAETRVRKNGRV